MARRHFEQRLHTVEADGAPGRDHDRHRLVRAIDRDLFGDVGERRPLERRGAHQDERLGREVDVLLVLGGVAGDRLVAELGELDADLGGGDAVGAVAHHRPVAPSRRQAGGGFGDRGATCEHLLQRRGQLAQPFEQADPLGIQLVVREGLAQRDREQEPGGDLRVERLGRRDAHLDVASVRGEENAVRLRDQIATAPVDHREHGGAATAREIDRAVGVGGGPRLADRDHQRVAHVGPQVEAGELGRRHRPDRDPVLRQQMHERVGDRLARHRRRPLADHHHAADGARAQPLAQASPTRAASPSSTRSRPFSSRILPRRVLRNEPGACEISLSR